MTAKPYRTTLKTQASLTKETSEDILRLATVFRYSTGRERTEAALAASRQATHPCELVRLMVIRSASHLNAQAGIDLTETIVGEAQAEGLAWTPLLDAIAHNDDQAALRQKRTKEALIAQANTAAEWARTASREDILEALEKFHSGVWQKMILLNCDVSRLHENDVERLASGAKAIDDLANNPSSGSREAAILLAAALKLPASYSGYDRDRRARLAAGLIEKFPDMDKDRRRQAMAETSQAAELARKARKSYEEIAGAELDAREVARAILQSNPTTADVESIASNHLMSTDLRARAMFHHLMGAEQRKQILAQEWARGQDEIQWEAVRNRYSEGAAEIAYYIPLMAQKLQVRDPALALLIRHPLATEETWKKAVGDNQPDNKAALARTPLARNAAVRAWLLESSSADTMASLLHTATAEEWPRLFLKLLKKDSAKAIATMAEINLPEGTVIETGWIAGKMATANEEERMKILACLKKCRAGTPELKAPERARRKIPR